MISLDQYKAGHYERTAGYQFFVPSEINDEWTWQQSEINALLEKAAVHLGELNSFSKLVPNIDLFIQMHVTKEAVVSSRIEGTQTNIGEAFLPEAEIPSERRNDWREVINYIRAMNAAVRDLQTLPTSSRLMCRTHAILMARVRGEQKQPGEFRRSQNWIGGHTLNDAVFVPPHHEYVGKLMGDLEKFLHNERIQTPALVRIAIVHYQFETIHPFLDGNGRIGRLLIPLYLVSRGILHAPLLYLSRFFEKDKGLYYDNLMRVRTHNDMTQWLKYFLTGVDEISAQAVQALMQVMQLKDKIEKDIDAKTGRRAGNALKLLNYLFKRPMTSINDAAKTCKITFKSAADLVKEFERLKILEELTGYSRNRIFVFKPYMKIFDEGL